MKSFAFVISLFFILSYGLSFSQGKTTDSLQRVLAGSKEDTSKVNTLINLSWENYSRGNIDEALSHIKEAIKLANKQGFKKGVIKGLIHNGIFNAGRSEYDSALVNYQRALTMAETLNEKKLISKASSNMGIVYMSQGDYQRALNTFYKSLAIDQELNNKTEIGKSFTNLGIVYSYMGNFPKSLECYTNALKIHEFLNEKRSIIKCYVNIGNLYNTQKDFLKAVDYFNKSLKLSKEMGDKQGLAKSYFNLGVAYKGLQEKDKAVECYNRALEFNRELNNPDGISRCYSSLGVINESLKNYDQALNYYKESLSIAEDLESKELIGEAYLNIGYLQGTLKNYKESNENAFKAMSIFREIENPDNLCAVYELLAKNFYSTGKHKQAYEYHVMFKNLVDSIFNIDNSEMLSDIKTNFEVEKKESELKLQQEKKDAVAMEESRRQVIIRNSIIICAVLFLVLAFLIYRNLHQSKKANEIIKLQKEEVEHQKELVEENRREILDSIHYAKRIQNTLLANKQFIDLNLPGNYVYFNPKDIVSGDFYWATNKQNRFYLAVCDSTGHGVPGAFMSLLNISFLNEAVNERNIEKPNEIFDHVRKRLIENISQEEQKDGMDGILVCFDNNTGTITYSAANNAPVLVCNNTLQHLSCDKMPVGKGERDMPFKLYGINNKDCMLYLYTDGYADQFGGPKGKKFKYKQLDELL
ncbi:MAG: tetratricopeptide repeat protein, partial [Bacteroidia bacterium]